MPFFSADSTSLRERNRDVLAPREVGKPLCSFRSILQSIVLIVGWHRPRSLQIEPMILPVPILGSVGLPALTTSNEDDLEQLVY